MQWCKVLDTCNSTTRMHYLERFTTTYSSIFSFYYDEIYTHQTKTSILYINASHNTTPPPLFLLFFGIYGLARVPIATRETRQHSRLIDNLNSGHVDNVSDIPRLSTNEKAGVGGLAVESGRVHTCKRLMSLWL